MAAGDGLWYAAVLQLEARDQGVLPRTHGHQVHALFLNLVRSVDPDLSAVQILILSCTRSWTLSAESWQRAKSKEERAASALAALQARPQAVGRVVAPRGVGDGRFGRVPPVSDPAAPCPARTGPSASRCGSLKSGRDARAPGRDGRAPVGGEQPDAGGSLARRRPRQARDLRLPERPGEGRPSTGSRFGWGCCNREAGVRLSWTRRAHQRARRPRSQGAVAPPRCSVLGARFARAARDRVRNRVQDILRQYTAYCRSLCAISPPQRISIRGPALPNRTRC
jgi:hypothetical protein